MKKIISTLIAVIMIVSMSLTAFASEYPATVTLDGATVNVQDGTQDVTLSLTFTLAEKVEQSMLGICFILPDGVTLTSYDDTQYGAFLADGKTVGNENDLASGLITLFDNDGENFEVGSFTIPVTFTVDTSVATEYEIALDADNTMLCDPDSNSLNNPEALPTATITVKKAVEYEEKTFSEKAAVDTNDITIGEDVYTNVAIFDAAIELPELKTGETFVKTGVKFGNLTKEFDVIGDVTYKILCYGITADQANALDVAAYYVAKVEKAN